MRLSRASLALVGAWALAGWLAAQEAAPQAPGRNGPRSAGKAAAKAKLPVTVTPEREAAVLTFIQRNHAELADLLAHLKENQPEAYEQAVRELFRTTERLAQIQERDPLQYELELAVWKAQSRVQLVSARMKMAVTEDLKKELREALAVQSDARLALLKHQRQQASERLTKLDADIARFEKDREKVIDRQLQLLTRTAEGGAVEGRGGKPGAKAADSKPGAKAADSKPGTKAAANKANGKKPAQPQNVIPD